MGKVSQAEHHVDLLQKEALGNLQLRMGEVGRSVTSLSIIGMSVLNSYLADAMSWLNELLNQSVGNRETQFFFSLRPKSVIELDTRRTSLQVERVGGSIFDVSETLRSSLTCLDRLNWQFTSSFVKFDVLPGPKVEKH